MSADDTFGAEPTLERVETLFGERPEVRDAARLAADPNASPMDTTKARNLLGWRPARRWADLRRAL